MSGSANDLEFGEVQEHLPEPPPLAPDRNGHLATAAVVRPHSKREPPRPAREPATHVSIALEAFLDMQQHAAEDTSIELGGLLLGRRGTHPDGTPWVMIVDSLRARHYRATRGSFRFTHDTWADLNAQRAELPESTEIVGWYHTHPGWGVFLSDQDIFICDHFFAHPDDVALVIDPTSGDTGLFVRRGSPRNRPPQRLDVYQLYAHRRRESELAAWAAYFSGVGTMSPASSIPDRPGSSRPAAFPSPQAPPVIVTTGGDAPGATRGWLPLAAGLLGAQLAILLAILVVLSSRPDTEPLSAEPAPSDSESLRIREAVVDELIESIAADGPEQAGRSWRETALANEQLRAANLGLLSRVDALTTELQTERQERQQAQQEWTRSTQQLDEAERQLAELRAELRTDQRAASVASATNDPAGDAPAAGSPAASTSAWLDWRAALAGAAGGLVVGWLVTSFAAQRAGPRDKPRDRPRATVEAPPAEPPLQ